MVITIMCYKLRLVEINIVLNLRNYLRLVSDI